MFFSSVFDIAFISFSSSDAAQFCGRSDSLLAF